MKRFLFAFALLVPLSPCWATSPDIERVTTAITPYLSDDTFAVATLGVDEAWPKAVGDMLIDYGIVPEDEVATLRQNLGQVKGALATLRGFGVREVTVVVGVADVRPQAGPLLVVTCDEPAKDALDMLLKQFLAQPTPKLSSQWVGDHVLVGTSATIERYETLQKADRKDLVDGLHATLSDDASGGLVAAPGDDVRRVLRELWPTLPAPFTDLDATLMADGVRELRVTLRRPPEWQARVTLEAASDVDAKTLKTLAERGLAQLVIMASQQQGGEPIAAALTQAVPLLRPKQQDNKLTIDLAHDNPQVKQMVINVMLPTLASARESARRNSRMNDMKWIALAMHNYHDTFGSFPASAAICDKDGKPLLSWRVAVLPFIEENELYQKFHLDEPWDSEHNLKLAKDTLPGVYFGNVSDELKQQGKTTYQLPVTEETGFAPIADAKIVERNFGDGKAFAREGTRIQNITDGTSNTIMVVQVADENAVFWSKPDDWSPDLADPLAKLKQAGRDGFVSANMDGSARVIPFEVDIELLKKLLTRAGREVIDWDEIP